MIIIIFNPQYLNRKQKKTNHTILDSILDSINQICTLNLKSIIQKTH